MKNHDEDVEEENSLPDSGTINNTVQHEREKDEVSVK